jgi:hypothetical protein
VEAVKLAPPTAEVPPWQSKLALMRPPATWALMNTPPAGLVTPPDTCPAAIGGVGVYRDEHHPSTVFAATLAPFIWSDLRQLGFLGAQ